MWEVGPALDNDFRVGVFFFLLLLWLRGSCQKRGLLSVFIEGLLCGRPPGAEEPQG